MITINGKYNFAHIMCDEVEDNVREQIELLLNLPMFKGEQIRIMADTHFGMGCVIGFTSTLGDYVVPNLVGVDIGCGIEAYCLGKQEIDFQALDDFIRGNIPSGKNVRKEISPLVKEVSLIKDKDVEFNSLLISQIDCQARRLFENIEDEQKRAEKMKRVFLSLGTLGAGNHYISLERDENGRDWLCVHTGSRNFGLQIANYHQNKAKELAKKFFLDIDDKYKDLEFLPMDKGGEHYLFCMGVAQKYAALNRHVVAREILEFLGHQISEVDSIKTVHNYIEITETRTVENANDYMRKREYPCKGIVRKGAISAKDGERVVIPINMKDGSLLGIGKGSRKWNFSAPHGAGRIMGRNEAKRKLNLDDFKESMKGIWTSCLSEKTLDESPLAYKDKDFILNSIEETVEVTDHLKTVYNFKSQD